MEEKTVRLLDLEIKYLVHLVDQERIRIANRAVATGEDLDAGERAAWDSMNTIQAKLGDAW